MSIVVSSDLILTQSDITPDHPIVLWDSLVTGDNISADTEDPDYPAENMASPATHQRWVASAARAQHVMVVPETADDIDSIAIAKHNLSSQRIPVKVQGASADGALIPALGAFIGNMVSAGGLAAAFDGSPSTQASDCAAVTGASGFVGNNFGSPGVQIGSVLAYGSRDQGYVSSANSTVTLELWGKSTSGSPASATDGDLLGSTILTDTTNESTGRRIWSNDTDTLYRYSWLRVRQSDAAATMRVAQLEFYEPNFVTLCEEAILPNDGPTLWRWTPQPLMAVRLRLGEGDAPAWISGGVMAGKLLVLPRKLYQGMGSPIMQRTTKVLNAMSEAGDFLGRIELQRRLEPKVPLSLIDPDYYRTYIDPFIAASKTRPFYFGWRPESFPYDIVYAQMTNDPQPMNESPHGLVRLALEMTAIAA